jgi:hypothetical protein
LYPRMTKTTTTMTFRPLKVVADEAELGGLATTTKPTAVTGNESGYSEHEQRRWKRAQLLFITRGSHDIY